MMHLMLRGTRSVIVFLAVLLCTTVITYRRGNIPIPRARFRPADHHADGPHGQRFHMDDGDNFRIGDSELKRAMQYEGTGERIQRFLRKARSGEGFTVSVVGGSVSKGRGLRPIDAPMRNLTGAATLYSQENMHWQIYDWLDARFPSANNRFINGAQGGVGAGYFAWCFGEHIPEDSDLILIELGINDVFSPSLSPKYEHLIRTLLTLPRRPAIINIEVFSLLFDTVMTSSSLHGDILAFYDVPSLSVRDLLMPSLTENPHEEIPRWFRTDPALGLQDTKVREWGGQMVDLLHFSRLGHALSAQVVIRYLQGMAGESARPWWALNNHYALPPRDIENLLTSPFDPLHPPILSRPTCRSVNANLEDDSDTITGIGRLAPFRGSSGWSEWQWKEKKYLVSRTPGSSVHFHFYIAPEDEQGLPDTDAQVLAELQKEHEAMLENDMGPGPVDVTHSAALEEALTNGDGNGEDDAKSQVQTSEVRRSRTPSSGPAKRQREPKHSGPPGSARLGTKLAKVAPVSKNHAVGLAFQRSNTFGLGKIKCWIDDNEAGGVVLDGFWDEPIRNSVVAETISNTLESGQHTLNCEHLPNDDGSATEFRIVAVMYD